MTLKEQLNEDLRAGLRAGETARKSALRMLLAAVHNAEIDAGRPLDDAGVLGVISREVKQRRESIEEYRKASRTELVAKEEGELAVIVAYLPAQLSHDEIAAEVRRIIGDVGATGPGDKGKVMSVVMPALRTRADGAEINAVVTEQLAQLG
jgi:uncharacterized protein YqeY